MILSMTGFASKEFETDSLKGSIEIKSVNSRYAEMNVCVPTYVTALERKIREFMATRITRGRIDVVLKLEMSSIPIIANIDWEACEALNLAFKKIESQFQLESKASVADYISFEGIVALERKVDIEHVWGTLLPFICSCSDEFTESRKTEGVSLARDLENKIDQIRKALAVIAEAAPRRKNEAIAVLRDRFAEAFGDSVDEGRILAEAALFLLKYTNNEEITRIISHLDALEKCMLQGSAGRRMDFIAQEIGREVNTIGAKSTVLEVSHSVIDIKDALENIREQLRNIE